MISSLDNSDICADVSNAAAVTLKNVVDPELQNNANSNAHNLVLSDSTAISQSTTDDGNADTGPATESDAVPSSGKAVVVERGSEGAEATAGSLQSSDVAPDADLVASASTEGQNVYHVKWIKFRGSQMPIVMQNQNGPCPLLAIVNVLLLQGKIKLSASTDFVASDQLMAYIADWIFDNVPKVCLVKL